MSNLGYRRKLLLAIQNTVVTMLYISTSTVTCIKATMVGDGNGGMNVENKFYTMYIDQRSNSLFPLHINGYWFIILIRGGYPYPGTHLPDIIFTSYLTPWIMEPSHSNLFYIGVVYSLGLSWYLYIALHPSEICPHCLTYWVVFKLVIRPALSPCGGKITESARNSYTLQSSSRKWVPNIPPSDSTPLVLVKIKKTFLGEIMHFQNGQYHGCGILK